MNEQIMERIDTLAEQLGVVGAHLWDVLVLQSYVYGAQTVLNAMLFGAALWAYFKFMVPAFKDEWDREIPLGFALGALALWGLFTILFLLEGVGCVINPEFCALSKVLP